MKPMDERISDAARGSCDPRSGVGSFLDANSQYSAPTLEQRCRTHSRTKKGFSVRTTGSECDRYDSYLNRRVSLRHAERAQTS